MKEWTKEKDREREREREREDEKGESPLGCQFSWRTVSWPVGLEAIAELRHTPSANRNLWTNHNPRKATRIQVYLHVDPAVYVRWGDSQPMKSVNR